MNPKLKEAANQKFYDVDNEQWAELYKIKLQFCYEPANFQADAKKNPDQLEFKEKKREIMIELIDILDDGEIAEEYLHNEDILRSSIVMIEKNIFRTFANKNNKKHQLADPDEDEPHLEEAWPHLQLVYELFLKFMMSPTIPNQMMAKNISKSFVV